MPAKKTTHRDMQIYEFLKEGFDKHLQKKYLFKQVREKFADLTDYSINRIYERYHDKAKIKELEQEIASLKAEIERISKKRNIFSSILF